MFSHRNFNPKIVVVVGDVVVVVICSCSISNV